MNNPNTNSSRKALKTKRLIANVLAELLEVKDLKSITVQEIALKAEISRTTFYNYFMDVYDIYEQTEKTVIEDFSRIMLEFATVDEHVMYTSLFSNIGNNPNIFKMIFNPKTTSNLRDKLGDLFESLCIKIWMNKVKETNLSIVQSYMIHYHAQGLLSIIGKWALNNYKDSKDDLIKTISLANKNLEKSIAG